MSQFLGIKLGQKSYKVGILWKFCRGHCTVILAVTCHSHCRDRVFTSYRMLPPKLTIVQYRPEVINTETKFNGL